MTKSIGEKSKSNFNEQTLSTLHAWGDFAWWPIKWKPFFSKLCSHCFLHSSWVAMWGLTCRFLRSKLETWNVFAFKSSCKTKTKSFFFILYSPSVLLHYTWSTFDFLWSYCILSENPDCVDHMHSNYCKHRSRPEPKGISAWPFRE